MSKRAKRMLKRSKQWLATHAKRLKRKLDVNRLLIIEICRGWVCTAYRGTHIRPAG